VLAGRPFAAAAVNDDGRTRCNRGRVISLTKYFSIERGLFSATDDRDYQ
jgi:hypothetical protein